MSESTTAKERANENSNDENKKQKPTWLTWASRIITVVFFIAVPVLLYMLVKNVDWQEVKDSISGYKTSTLLIGAVIVIVSYAIFTSYDLLARHYTQHKLPATQILPVAFVCYAFNLNLSAWVGSLALRFRLYSRLGLDVPTITKIMTINILTNWLGYILLAGSIFSLRLLKLPEEWALGTTALQLIGFGLLSAAAIYLLACAFAKRRTWTLFKHEITLPSIRFALTQAAIGSINWAVMGLMIFNLLPEEASYPTVLGILLICGIAGVVTHIPAGLGVLEGVFIAMLQHEFSKGTILGALITYRAIYYLIPLALACITYLILEQQAKKLRANNETEQQPATT